MGTQAVVSVRRGGKVIVKAVCGCNGQPYRKLALVIKKKQLDTIEKVLAAAQDERVCFGCDDCLVVMDASRILAEGEIISSALEEYYTRYRKTFNDPNFNPRWERGDGALVKVVDLDT